MIGTWLIASAVLLLLIGGWVAVQAAARRVARQHPEAGPYREAGGGCGGVHACGSCDDGDGKCAQESAGKEHGRRAGVPE